MDKINYISEPHDVETQNVERAPTITYDHIMNRLMRHLIVQDTPITTQRSQIPIDQKPKYTPQSYTTSKMNKKTNNERMPGYVKPYAGKTPTGELNSPVNNQIPSNANANTPEMNKQLLLMRNTALRNIALHNNNVMAAKKKSQLKFQ
jgi:hypothetical protein